MAWKVPFVDYPTHLQKMEDEITALIKDVLFTRADLILRSDLQEFESNIASFCGVDYAVGVANCTDALFLSLKAAGICPGDEIITVAHTFVATVEAIVHCGAKPVLVDVAPDGLMDVDRVESVITAKTRAVVPVHLNGRICDMEKLFRTASKHNLIIIEDSAQALGATFNGQKAGSFGLAGCFSFYPAKLLGAAGDGGVVTTNSKEIADKIRLMRDHFQDRAAGEILGFGYNSRLDNLQAALLDLKLKYLPAWIERRRELADIYDQGLKDIEQLSLMPAPVEDGKYYDVYQNYVIRSLRRDELVAYLKDKGVETLISWPRPMHHHEALNLSHFSLPETERLSREVVSLPMNTEVSDEQAAYLIETVKSFHAEQGILLGSDSSSSRK